MEKAHILIADDIFSNQLLLKSIIEETGHYCKVVSNGKLAIEEIMKNSYTILLTDIEMPVMNGIETAIYIRTKMNKPYKEMPIIALTAHNMNEFSDKIKDAGFTDIITKPYSVQKFKEILEKHLPKNEN